MKKRLRDQYRSLDPVWLLAEIRATQDELGNRVDRRAGQPRGLQPAYTSTASGTAATFANTLGKPAMVGEPRATHRRTRRPYKTRARMPRPAERETPPEEFGTRQHSIVQRLLRALRRKAAQGPLGDAASAAPLPGLWTARAM